MELLRGFLLRNNVDVELLRAMRYVEVQPPLSAAMVSRQRSF